MVLVTIQRKIRGILGGISLDSSDVLSFYTSLYHLKAVIFNKKINYKWVLVRMGMLKRKTRMISYLS
jgi:hypothetical protein